jgi:tetratricopeptide (TPR) repeat protein
MRSDYPFNPLGCVAVVSLLLWFCCDAVGQTPAVRRTARQQQELQTRLQQKMKEAAENQPVLPSDPQLLSLHREFITKAEKLASEYERKKQYDRAREVYESLVRLVPKYDKAEQALKSILQAQAMKERKVTEVLATREWQDSGASIQKDMPVFFDVRGTWKVVLETGPEGVRIPEEMRQRNHRIQLGTLIGVIVANQADLKDAKPFIVTPGQEFISDRAGRLYLRMFDIDPTDNEGKLYVMIQSTFAK